MTPETFLQLADLLPEPTLLVSGSGTILAANRVTHERLGLPANAIGGQPLPEVVSDSADKVAHYPAFAAGVGHWSSGALTVLGQQPLPCRAEGAVLRPTKDGSEALILLRLVPKHETAASFLALNQRIEALGKEMHRRKAAEEVIRQQQDRLQVTLSSIGDAVIATDAEGRVTFLNAVAEGLTGWPQTEAVGRPLPEVFQIINEYSRKPVENPAQRTLREGTVVGLANHTILIARDGTERPIDDSAAPIRGEAPTPVGAVLVFRDVTERRQAEEARARLAAIVESSEDAIISKTLDGTIQSWNTGAERLFGYTSSEAVGQSITLIIPSERLDEERDILEHLRRGERVEHFDTVRVTKESRRIDISLTVSPIRNRDGQVVGASKVARDITARKLAEEVLRESEERNRRAAGEAARAAETNAKFRTLFEQGTQFAGILTPDGTVVEANRLSLDACGFTREEVIGKLFWECGWWNRSSSLMEMVRAACVQAAEGQPFRTETNYFVADGTERFVDLIISPVTADDGRVLFINPTGTDITERKRAEKALTRVTAESDRRKRLYEAILTATPDFVYVFSLDHRILYANDALIAMWGYSLKDTIGKTFVEVGYEPWHAEMHNREIDQVRATKKPIRGEVPFTGTNGRRIYDYIFVPVIGADGEVEAVAGTTRDVTDRKTMEDTLREADRKKDEFIALLAHELRNPLAPIRNGLQVLELAPGDTQEANQAREMMDRQLGHMVRLIDDLLDVSRISRNKMELRRARIALADVLSSALETAKPLIEEAGHHLTLSLPSAPVYLQADLMRLAQVFSNLLTNSAKYTPPGGRIWLSAERRAGEVAMSVRDTGIGIPAESLPGIFDMFSQVDRGIERNTGGLGIGLALVKGLVEMHGGAVSAASEGEGQGSTFTVTLPVLKDQTRFSSAAVFKGRREGPGRRILVVDDSQDGAHSLAMMLRLMGHELQTAHDGLEAVERAEQFRPEVILMDVGMPRLNGLDATRRIREQPWGKTITIIALTGWGQEGDGSVRGMRGVMATSSSP